MNKLSSPLWICEYCDTVHEGYALKQGEMVRCQCCHSVLQNRSRFSRRVMLALAVTALLLGVIANLWPVFSLRLGDKICSTTPIHLVDIIWQAGFPLVAIIVLITLILAPLLRMGGLVWLLAFAVQGRRAPGFRNLFILLGYIRPWTMIEVFVLGVVVSIVKSQTYFSVALQPGIFAYAGLMLLLTLYTSYKFHELWEIPAKGAA